MGDSKVKVEILADGYDVKFNEAEITITDGAGVFISLVPFKTVTHVPERL